MKIPIAALQNNSVSGCAIPPFATAAVWKKYFFLKKRRYTLYLNIISQLDPCEVLMFSRLPSNLLKIVVKFPAKMLMLCL